MKKPQSVLSFIMQMFLLAVLFFIISIFYRVEEDNYLNYIHRKHYILWFIKIYDKKVPR